MFRRIRWNHERLGRGAKRYTFPRLVQARKREIPAREWMGKDPAIAVRATGPKGKISDWSNLVVLPVRPPLAKPPI